MEKTLSQLISEMDRIESLSEQLTSKDKRQITSLYNQYKDNIPSNIKGLAGRVYDAAINDTELSAKDVRDAKSVYNQVMPQVPGAIKTAYGPMIKRGLDQLDKSVSSEPAADPDATDPRGDQTTPPAATDETPPAVTGEPTSRLDTKGETPPADATQSNGSLLGRKLDTTTPNLMKAYNDGGKKAMPAINNLQTALSRLGFDPKGIDGKYGRGTYAAVQAFQKANGLKVDGQAGPNTMSAIKKALDDAPTQGQPTSRLDTKGQTPSAESVELNRIKGLAGL